MNHLKTFLLGGSVLLFLVLGSMVCRGQQSFRTLKLAALAEKLKAKGIVIGNEGLYDASCLCAGQQVAVKPDLFGRVGSIGLQLFSQEMQAAYASPVYDFIGRYLLELLLLPKEEAAVMLEEDKVELLLNGSAYGQGLQRLDDYVRYINPGTPFTLTGDSVCYTAGWKLPQGSLRMVFPKRYELILGSDKMEMEKGFMEELARAHATRTVWDTLAVAQLQASPVKGYYVRRGTSYLIPNLISDTYYKSADGQRATLFFEKDLPAESLANLFQEGYYGNRRVTMKIEHRCYGNQVTRFEVDAQNWVEYCREHRCRIYFGPEDLDGEKVRGTVLVVNDDLGYNHLLYFECGRDIFDRLRPDMKVTLYTYVPTHNVKNLFSDSQN